MWDQRASGGLNRVISVCFICPRVPPAQQQLLLHSLLASDGCVKSGGGVFLGLSIYTLEPKSGVGGGIGGCLLNWKTGLLLYSPYCWSFPSCFACPLTQLFMALGLAQDLSHTCQQQQVFFELSTITVFLLVQFHIKLSGKMCQTFMT